MGDLITAGDCTHGLFEKKLLTDNDYSHATSEKGTGFGQRALIFSRAMNSESHSSTVQNLDVPTNLTVKTFKEYLFTNYKVKPEMDIVISPRDNRGFCKNSTQRGGTCAGILEAEDGAIQIAKSQAQDVHGLIQVCSICGAGWFGRRSRCWILHQYNERRYGKLLWDDLEVRDGTVINLYPPTYLVE